MKTIILFKLSLYNNFFFLKNIFIKNGNTNKKKNFKKNRSNQSEH